MDDVVVRVDRYFRGRGDHIKKPRRHPLTRVASRPFNDPIRGESPPAL